VQGGSVAQLLDNLVVPVIRSSSICAAYLPRGRMRFMMMSGIRRGQSGYWLLLFGVQALKPTVGCEVTTLDRV